MVVSNIFYFHPYLGKIPILTNVFQMGWNHQPENSEIYVSAHFVEAPVSLHKITIVFLGLFCVFPETTINVLSSKGLKIEQGEDWVPTWMSQEVSKRLVSGL